MNPTAAQDDRALAMGRQVLEIELAALSDMAGRLGTEFSRAVAMILASSGRVIVCGIGKSGHIGRKMAATFASTA